jgi:UDPglucose--hexose-1-phosphate uridylyltransferase
MNLSDYPHRRLNPLTGEWTLVSCHRAKRPWQGKVELPPAPEVPAYDPKCALCPGNVRAGNQKNPPYDATFAFDNDFPALLPDIPVESLDHQGLLVAAGEQGRCRVVCYCPNHALSLPLMSSRDICGVIDTWESEFRELSASPDTGYISIFESKGDLLGALNPHPHCQIWAHATVPDLPARETIRQKEYLDKNKSCLLCSYAAVEHAMKARIVDENEHFIAVVPFWAAWPFEVLIVPRNHAADITGLPPDARAACADMLHSVAVRYDNMHSFPFPYAMAVHQRPLGKFAASEEEWHFHIHFLPPIARNGTSRKHTAAFDLLFMQKRDNTPEEAARKLRGCSREHYTKQNPSTGSGTTLRPRSQEPKDRG